jgi:transcriptional regulator
MTPAPARRAEIPPGTLDMLILQTVARVGSAHGFEIAEAIGRASCDVLEVEEGSLYPALQRLMLKGWLDGEWGRTAENRRARYYQITTAGKKQLARELESYRLVSHAIAGVLRLA